MAYRLQPLSKTATATILTSESDAVIVNNSTAAATYTLPTPVSNQGMEFTFFNAVDQNMIISAGTGLLIAFNNASAASIAASTSGQKIGATVKVVSNGSKWCVLSVSPGAATFTIA